MNIYPTLCELCGLERPKHVEGESVVSLLKEPSAMWEHPALTTHEFQNHAVRSEKWRYIRYENGEEELYDEVNDPMEWKNLANDPQYADVKAELAKRMPVVNVDTPAGKRSSQDKSEKPNRKQKVSGKKAA